MVWFGYSRTQGELRFAQRRNLEYLEWTKPSGSNEVATSMRTLVVQPSAKSTAYGQNGLESNSNAWIVAEDAERGSPECQSNWEA